MPIYCDASESRSSSFVTSAASIRPKFDRLQWQRLNYSVGRNFFAVWPLHDALVLALGSNLVRFEYLDCAKWTVAGTAAADIVCQPSRKDEEYRPWQCLVTELQSGQRKQNASKSDSEHSSSSAASQLE